MKAQLMVRVIDGKLLHLSDLGLRQQVRRLKDGVYMLTLHPPKKRKSPEALGYFFNSVIPEIAAHTGETRPLVKDSLVGILTQIPRFSKLGTWVGTQPISQMDQERFSEFIDATTVWAAQELGLAIEEADPNWKYRLKEKS